MTIEMLQDNNNSGFATFDEVVRLICSYLGDEEASKLYTKVARFLGLALEDLSLKVLPSVKSVVLPVLDNYTINLPYDFMEIVKVGVCCHNKEIKLLGRNHNLCKTGYPAPAVIECCTCEKEEGNEQNITDDTNCCAACTFHNVSATYGIGSHYFSTDHFYLYGYQPKQQFITGTYDVDYDNNRLLLGSGCEVKPGNGLIVEYSASLSGDKFKLIPRRARTALMYKVAHMIDKDEREWKHFKIEYLELKRSFDRYSLKDWVAAIRGGYHLAPKR